MCKHKKKSLIEYSAWTYRQAYLQMWIDQKQKLTNFQVLITNINYSAYFLEFPWSMRKSEPLEKRNPFPKRYT